MNTPSVSVIMPAYNAARYVREAIDSVLSQTLTDFELIVVNDASIDGTAEILASYSDPRVIVINHDFNRGMTQARNTGIARARGVFLATLDSDDVAVADRLARQRAYLDAHADVDAVGGAVELIDEESRSTGDIRRFPIEPQMVAWYTLFLTPVAHPTLMIRRSALDRIGGYDEHDRLAEDYGLYERLLGRGRVSNLSEVVTRYRRTAGQASNASQARQEADAEVVCQRIVEGVLAEPSARYDLVRETNVPYRRVPPNLIRSLRGLSRGRYPSKAIEISELGRLVTALARAFDQPEYRRLYGHIDEIRRDAASRLWLLALLAVRRVSLRTAVACALRAVRLSPVGGLTLAARKALAR